MFANGATIASPIPNITADASVTESARQAVSYVNMQYNFSVMSLPGAPSGIPVPLIITTSGGGDEYIGVGG